MNEKDMIKSRRRLYGIFSAIDPSLINLIPQMMQRSKLVLNNKTDKDDVTIEDPNECRCHRCAAAGRSACLRP